MDVLIPSGKELAELIKGRESETLECKDSFDKEAMETAGAFANTRGGMVLVGVKKKGNISGTDVNDEILKDWANEISNVSEPRLIPYVGKVDMDDGTIAVILVKEHPLKPVSIRGRCYRRVAASNRRMTPAEISEMHMETVGSTWDSLPVSDKTVDDLDMELVKRYMEIANGTGRRAFGSEEGPEDILAKLELLKDSRPTWATVIAFGKRPPMQAKVKCGRIRGTHNIVDDYVVDVPLMEQANEVMNYMKRVLQLSYEFKGESRRSEVWEYPLDALKEAVANAICHRDYTSPAEIQIKIFDDELVIWNPGPLPLGMTLEKLMDPRHNSVPRNRQIAMLFYDTEIIERYGSGIERILDECRRLGFPEPEFNEYQNGFQVIFHKDIYTLEHMQKMGLTEKQIKTVLLTKERGKITNRELQETTGMSRATATRELTTLLEKNLLEKHGTGRGIYYTIKRAS